MNRFKRTTIVALALILVPSTLVFGYGEVAPEVYLESYNYYVGVGDTLEIRADDLSVGAYIYYWGGWTFTPSSGYDILDTEFDTGYQPNYATADVQFNEPGKWRVSISATSNAGTDWGWAYVYVLDVDIDDVNTPSAMLCQDPNGATIHYSLEPTTFTKSRSVDLIVKDSSQTTVRTVSLSDTMGDQSYTWDGKDANGVWVDPDEYTVTVELTTNYGQFTVSDSHTISVVSVDIDETNSENYVSLDGSDVAEIYYSIEPSELNCTYSANLVIKDNGVTVKTIALTDPLGTDKVATWDGRNASGTLVSAGVYTASIELIIGSSSVPYAAETSVTGCLPATVWMGENDYRQIWRQIDSTITLVGNGSPGSHGSITSWDWKLIDGTGIDGCSLSSCLGDSGSCPPEPNAVCPMNGQVGAYDAVFTIHTSGSGDCGPVDVNLILDVFIIDTSTVLDYTEPDLPYYTYETTIGEQYTLKMVTCIPTNDDDDDGDGLMDGPISDPIVAGDNDRIPLNWSMETPQGAYEEDGHVTLQSFGGVSVWTAKEGGNCLLDASGGSHWFGSGVYSGTLYVQGVSAAEHARLGLYYTDKHGARILPAAPVEEDIYLDVVQVDMDLAGVVDSGGTTQEKTGGVIGLGSTKALTVNQISPSSMDPNVTLSVEYSGTGTIGIKDANGTDISLPHAFDADSTTTFSVTATNASDANDPYDICLVLTHGQTGFEDRINLCVASLNLNVTSVADANEESPGAFILLNDDNDIDLIRVEFELVPESLPIDMSDQRVTLEDVSGGARLTFYQDPNKSGQPYTPLFYFPSREIMSVGMWVEGTTVSGGLRDIELRLEYTTPGGDELEDTVFFTVFDVDIDVNGVPDEEEVSVGGFLSVNNDDDNGDEVVDTNDTTPLASGDGDLRIIDLECSPYITGWKAQLNLTGTQVRVWDDFYKNRNVVGLAANEWFWYGFPPSPLCVEGISSASDARLTLSYKDANDITVVQDEVSLVVMDVNFVEHDSQAYGFDNYGSAEFWPHKSVEVNETDVVSVEIEPSVFASAIAFLNMEPNSISCSPSVASASPQTLTLTGLAEYSDLYTQEIYTFFTGTSIFNAMRLNVHAFEEDHYNVAICVVHDTYWDSNEPLFDANDLQTYLNGTVFNQAVISTTVTIVDPCTVHFDVDGGGDYDCLPDPNDPNDTDEESYIVDDCDPGESYHKVVYLISNPNPGYPPSAGGYAIFNDGTGRYAFVFIDEFECQSSLRAIAHELAHLIGGLGDLYPPYSDSEDTENLMHMDGLRLRHNQWQKLHGLE